MRKISERLGEQATEPGLEDHCSLIDGREGPVCRSYATGAPFSCQYDTMRRNSGRSASRGVLSCLPVN